MAQFIFPAVTINTAGLATEAKQDTQITELQSINTELNTQTTELQSVNTELNTQTTELQSVNTELDTQTGHLASIAAEDFATEATLASIAAIDFATEAKQDTQITELQSVNTELDTQTGHLASIAGEDFATETTLSSISSKVSNLTVVDQLDTPLLDISSTNIPASASLPVQVVASLAAGVKKIISVEDVGEYIGLYTGAAASEVLLCILPLGGGEVEVVINAGTRISLRHMKNSAISTGFFAINFLG